MDLSKILKIKSGSTDDIIADLIEKLDGYMNESQVKVDDIISYDKINDSDINIDGDTVITWTKTLFGLILNQDLSNDSYVDIPVITNYTETGEGPLKYTTNSQYYVPATVRSSSFGNSASIFFSFNQDNTVECVTSAFNAWYTNFIIPWHYQFDVSSIRLYFDDINFVQFKELNPIDEETGDRIVFKNRLGEKFDLLSSLLATITNTQPMLIMRDALEMVKARDYSAASLLARIDKYGGYANLTASAKSVYQDIVSVLSYKNPMALLILFKGWLENNKISEEDITFSESPALVQSLCFASIAKAIVGATVNIIGIVLMAVSKFLGILIMAVGAAISAIWDAVSTLADATYSIAWGENLDNDTDSRSIDAPFYRGYITIPESIKRNLLEYKLLKLNVPGAEIVIWDNNDLTDNLGCIEIRPSVSYNLFKFDVVTDSYCSNSIFTRRNTGNDTMLVLNSDLTVEELINECIDNYYDPLIMLRDIKSEEIEYRVSSSFFIFTLWLMSIIGNDDYYFAGLNSTSGQLNFGVTYGFATSGSFSPLNLPPLVYALGGCAIMSKHFELSDLVKTEEGYYCPQYKDEVSDDFNVEFLNKAIIPLCNIDYSIDDPSNNIVTCSAWFNLNFSQNNPSLLNPALWIDRNLNHVAPTSINTSVSGNFSANANILTVIAADNNFDINATLLKGSYKGVPFCRIPKFTTRALITSAIIAAAVIAVVAVAAAIAFSVAKRAAHKYQLANKAKLDAKKQALVNAAQSGDKKQYKRALKDFKRSVRVYNAIGSATGNATYNSYSGLLSQAKPTYATGTSNTLQSALETTFPTDDAVDAAITLDTIMAVLKGVSEN